MIDHPITNPLSPIDQALVEILAERWVRSWKWPVYDYLNRTLASRTGASAVETMSRLPVAQASPQTQYRLIFTERGGPFAEANQRVGLTLAGMRHVADAKGRADQVVEVIRWLAQADAQLEPDPDRAVSLEVPLLELLSTDLRVQLRGWSPETLGEILEHEPALWGSISPSPERKITLRGGHLSSFLGVQDVDDYVERAIRWLGADRSARPAPLYPSPLQLPEALGYLDAIWRARFGRPLLGRTQPATAAKLALDCRSSDELEARLSAVADVLGHFDVDLPAPVDAEAKAGNERSLSRLRRRLKMELDERGYERAASALVDLQRVVRIRAGAQHSGIGGEIADAFRELELPYPPANPADAWVSIRAVTLRAVDVLREEIQAADRSVS
jgi:hypothetical protein